VSTRSTIDIEFPRLADTLVDGIVSAWYKRPGDQVVRGEPLFAVETDKVNTDVRVAARRHPRRDPRRRRRAR